jgi:hypothetical protein
MTVAASGQLLREARTRANFCQECIGSRPSQSDGCSVPTREPWMLHICPVT